MNPSQLPSHIFGMHDTGAEQLFAEAGKQAWIVVSVLATDAPGDFSALANQGHAVIVRLNHGYFPQGTIPFSSQYDAFASACANHVAGSRGVNLWIIGNETNLKGEQPGADDPARHEKITPALYAQCFKKCRTAIRNAPGHSDDWVIPSPPGPWNTETQYPGNESGDWVIYFRQLLEECVKIGALPDALALHTYSNHGVPMSPALIESEEWMANSGFPTRHWQFRAYRDFLGVVPASLRTLPVFITESQHLPWEDRNVGWIQKAYAEIDAWNSVSTNQPIQALCLFRWHANPHDETQAGWSLSDRPQLRDDLRAAFQNNYLTRWLNVPAPVQPDPGTKPSALLPLDKIRWFTEEAVRKLEAGDPAAARDILVNMVSPWFYQSYPQHSSELVKAQAHAQARWFSEETTRRIEANKPAEARDLLVTQVLPWLTSTGPHELGILGIQGLPKKRKPPKRSGGKKPRGRKPVPGVLGIEEGAPPAAPLRETLLAQGDAHQLLPFNKNASLQKQIFADGLVPNSAEFNFSFQDITYVAQRAEHLLTGEVRVYYAPTTNFADVHFAGRDASPALNTPFKGGNRITQVFAARPEYYQQFHLAGHEGVDMVPKDGDRDLYCVEDGTVLRAIDVPGDPKTNAYGIYVAIYNAANHRLWYYCHMSEKRVNLKQQVSRGDVLGRMGGTGNVQGDHLHLNLKLLDASGLPLTPDNGYKGWSDPLSLVNALNAASATASTPLHDALLAQATARQSIAFNTQAALQKQMFVHSFIPNSAEFNIEVDGASYVAQRAENLNTGAVRVYYAPTTNFADVSFVER